MLTREKQFRAHFDQHRPAVMAYVLRRIAADEAQDVVAETFLVAWRRLESIPSDALPWLLGVARKVISTRYRSHERKVNLDARLKESARVNQSEWPTSDRKALAGAFLSLSDGEQEILMLIGWEGLNVSQAARVVGCSPSSLSVRLHRARKRLSRLMEAETDPFLSAPVTWNPEEAG